MNINPSENLKKNFSYHLTHSLFKNPESADDFEKYQALALSVRDYIAEKWVATKETYQKYNPRHVNFISFEYLIGRTMGNSMINLGIYDATKDAMEKLGFDIEELRELEVDAGLGNGGLGRLAACFLDSLATMELPAIGYGVRYEYGIFKQIIKDGYQVEDPDNWLRQGNVWEIQRPDRTKTIRFYGNTEKCRKSSKPYKRQWVNTQNVQAMPYDTPIPGFNTTTVNTLRLWSAKSLYGLNLSSFNKGDYLNANLEALSTENITEVLYPNDDNYEGKELRLKQQYFLISATLQDIISRHKLSGGEIKDIHKKNSIHLNDTHPAMAVPELMRILVDEEDISWENAWDICTKIFNYTNHSLMAEALEKWPVAMIGKLLPRHLEIIYEINLKFLNEVEKKYPGDIEKIRRMSLIEEDGEKMVRMAYIAVIGSAHVNGVAKLHTKLLKSGLFRDFYEFTPDKFVNVTNGITQRRWLLKANPELATLITEKIGDSWIKNLGELKRIEPFAKERDFQNRIIQIKRGNKENLRKYILKHNEIKVDLDSIFDVQVKRLHEYKRQLLNILNVIAMYLDIKDDPNGDFVPRTVIFGAKAAPGYYMAKLIIKFINAVADVINSDEEANPFLKVVFIANYGVSIAEKIIPAADLSEQISLAGNEASGTGNMKFALNGALTIGTMDGANIEIHNVVGPENIFIFGFNVEEIQELRRKGYKPENFLENSPRLKRVLELVRSGLFSQDEPERFKPLLDSLEYDYYMVIADFESYYTMQQEVSKLFRNKHDWAQKSVVNIANMGPFSSDRSIAEYSSKIWNIKPAPVK